MADTQIMSTKNKCNISFRMAIHQMRNADNTKRFFFRNCKNDYDWRKIKDKVNECCIGVYIVFEPCNADIRFGKHPAQQNKGCFGFIGYISKCNNGLDEQISEMSTFGLNTISEWHIPRTSLWSCYEDYYDSAKLGLTHWNSKELHRHCVRLYNALSVFNTDE